MKRLYLILALGLGVLAGCSAFTGPVANPQVAAQFSKLTYPANAKLGPDLDILVVDHGSNLQLVNRTDHSYHNLYLWLNQQWVGKVASIRIGTDNSFNLDNFINRFGEPYPFGSLLQPDKAMPVVLAELYDPTLNVRYRLVARRTGL